MKNNLFLQIKIIINTLIYIVCALSGALSGVLCSALCGALCGDYSTPDSTPQNSSIVTSFLENRLFSAQYKREGFVNYINNTRGRWIGFYFPFWPDSSVHQERKRSNEICKNRTIYEYLHRS